HQANTHGTIHFCPETCPPASPIEYRRPDCKPPIPARNSSPSTASSVGESTQSAIAIIVGCAAAPRCPKWRIGRPPLLALPDRQPSFRQSGLLHTFRPGSMDPPAEPRAWLRCILETATAS